jgi:hypothetical protein
VHPGKQLNWSDVFPTHRPATPSLLLPHMASEVQVVVHHVPVQSPDAQSELFVHGSRTEMSAAQTLVEPPATSVPVWHVAVW